MSSDRHTWPLRHILPVLVLLATIAMLCQPQAVYQGACRGLETWGTHLLPSLLPFFIAANLLLQLGIVPFLGVLLEDVMRPLFRLPGAAGFVVALGFTSGFPMGAVLTASLREQQLCTRQEAARLAAFTNNASPLFLLVAVPVSMLHAPQTGLLLLLAHHLANLTLGILLGLLSRDSAALPPPVRQSAPPLQRALQQLRRHQQQHCQPAGAMLSQAIRQATDSILAIGGFVLLFSVLLSLLEAAGLLQLLQALLAQLLLLARLPEQLATPLSWGLFEMTLGTQRAAQTNLSLPVQLMLISFLLGWSGLSIQAQVSSILAGQHISARLYCLCRPLQGLLAAAYLPLLLWLCPAAVETGLLQYLPTGPALLWWLPWLGSLTLLALLLVLAALLRRRSDRAL